MKRSGSILDKTEEILNDILFVHSHIKGYLKSKYLKLNDFFQLTKVRCCKKKPIHCIGAGAGEKKNHSRSKTDWLRNTSEQKVPGSC